MKIWICAYRDWAKKIFVEIKKNYKCKLIKSKEEFNNIKNQIKKNDKIFFLGWSWIVPENIITKYDCICLHPSPLPKYRGGSPIQHQIINGENKSAVTFFRMEKKLDSGNILFQKKFSLNGDLQNIFSRITSLGILGISNLLNNKIKEQVQNEKEATFFKRRIPKESEILVEDFKKNSAKAIYNKIRSLQDPYPNAFVVCRDGKKIFFKKIYYQK